MVVQAQERVEVKVLVLELIMDQVKARVRELVQAVVKVMEEKVGFVMVIQIVITFILMKITLFH